MDRLTDDAQRAAEGRLVGDKEGVGLQAQVTLSAGSASSHAISTVLAGELPRRTKSAATRA